MVEDNPDGRESLRDLLEIWGHRVELAGDGSEGLARLLTAPPDVALIDIGLPALLATTPPSTGRSAVAPSRAFPPGG